MVKHVFLYIAFIFVAASAQAQVEFTAAVKTGREITTDDQFNLEIKTNTDGKFTAPDLKDFEIIQNYQGSSVNTSYINGKWKSTQVITITYRLKPKKPGKLVIGSASLIVDGKTYKTVPLTVEVTKGAPQKAAGNFGSNAKVIASATPSKKEVYQGESFTILYKVYTPYRFTNILKQDFPNYKNFVKYSLLAKNIKKYDVTQEVIKGKRYQVLTLEKVLLTPGTPGEFSLDPFEIEVGLTDGWGWNSFKASAKSNTVSINVKALPENGKPEDFTGAVGKFNIEAEISNRELKEGDDGFDLKVMVSGKGDPEFDEPKIELPKEFDSYPPEADENFNASSSGVKVTKSWNYFVVPLANGTFSLGPFDFTYFDPEIGDYRTISTDSIQISVDNPNIQEKRLADESKKLGLDGIKELRFIHTENDLVQNPGFILDEPLYWVGIGASPVLFLLFLLVRSRKSELSEDEIRSKRAKRAARIAKQKLQSAYGFVESGQKQEFFVENLRGLYGYLSEKLGMKAHEMSKDGIRSALSSRGVNETTLDGFINILEDCELARYGAIDQDPKPIYELSIDHIMQIEEQIA